MYYRRRLNKILAKLKEGAHTRIATRYSLIVPRFSAPGKAVKVEELDREIEEAYAPILEEVDAQAATIAGEFITLAGGFTRTALIAALASVGISTRGAVGVTSTSKEAIGREVDMVRPPNMDAVLEQSIRDNVDLIRSIPREDKLRIERMVRDSIRHKRDLYGLQEELQTIEDIGYRRAKIIARDQNNKVTEDITRERNKALGITQGMWIHRGGSKNPRETHMAFNGQVFELETGLFDDDVGKNVLPAELINCFPGSVEVNHFPFAEKIYRRFYSGELSTVITDNGVILTVTPNHPILTTDGWKATGLLKVGDKIIQTCTQTSSIASFNGHNFVTTFKELFDSLSLTGTMTAVFGSSASEFHGDGREGKIDIVDINSLLASVDDAQIIKKACDVGFTGAEMGIVASLFSGHSPSDFFSGCICSSSHSIMSHFCEIAPVFFCSLSIAERIRLACGAPLNMLHGETTLDNLTATTKLTRDCQFAFAALVHGLDKLMVNYGAVGSSFGARNFNTTLPNATAKAIGRNPNLFLQAGQGSSVVYSVNTVVDNRISDFTGHVYNLQTSLGYYIAQNTVCQNCHCTFKPIIPDTL